MEGECEKVFNILSDLEDTNKNYNEIQTTNLPEKKIQNTDINTDTQHTHTHTLTKPQNFVSTKTIYMIVCSSPTMTPNEWNQMPINR